jgi:hypothetical protein
VRVEEVAGGLLLGVGGNGLGDWCGICCRLVGEKI